MKKNIIVAAMLLAIVMLAGCNNTTPAEDSYGEATTAKAEKTTAASPESANDLTYEGSLKFVGLDKEFEIPYNDIYAMTPVTMDVSHISSSGEVSEQTVTGVRLEDLLQANGGSKAGFGSIRFTAGDGYAISMPAEVFADKDIILAWAFDGENLDDKKMPLRVAVNDERSMYFVANLVEVAFEAASEMGATLLTGDKVVFMESAFTLMETEDFMYYDSNDLAVSAKSLAKSYAEDHIDAIEFVASDGYAKSESFDVFAEGFIKINGEDAPLFTGLDLPKGMNVKYILKMVTADATFMSVNSGFDSAEIENVELDGDAGVKLSDLVAMAGLEAASYTITATDGYAKDVTQAELEIGMAYVNNDGTVTIKFNDDNPKKSKIKNALTIVAASGAPIESSEDKEATEEVEDVSGWLVTFDGLSDGAFDFDQDRAERKLEKVALHTEKMKDDVAKAEDWEGYRVLDILEWLKVDDFSSIIVVASDGYEVELVKDMVDEETILADVKNGEAMTDADNMVQLVQNTEFATTWVKGVAKIIVK